MVIDCSEEDVVSLSEGFQRLFEDERVFFALKWSQSVMMTCLLKEVGDGGHMHFVDEADGGYAEAALRLMEQKASMSASSN